MSSRTRTPPASTRTARSGKRPARTSTSASGCSSRSRVATPAGRCSRRIRTAAATCRVRRSGDSFSSPTASTSATARSRPQPRRRQVPADRAHGTRESRARSLHEPVSKTWVEKNVKGKGRRSGRRSQVLVEEGYVTQRRDAAGLETAPSRGRTGRMRPGLDEDENPSLPRPYPVPELVSVIHDQTRPPSPL